MLRPRGARSGNVIRMAQSQSISCQIHGNVREGECFFQFNDFFYWIKKYTDKRVPMRPFKNKNPRMWAGGSSNGSNPV